MFARDPHPRCDMSKPHEEREATVHVSYVSGIITCFMRVTISKME